ncbi:cytochrome c oxidase assembly protein subunit 15 [Vibrio xiamenensis]|uniref:Cytochrome c oxidase assembly protein subunit 15 n=1 Tax=Vibrio xiamenensis TaxID=861298 RepID=A0A1G8GVU9_9VIBR|nr:COX15/CtaA family protein [Vibrio xiamenensis]SDH98489.1 cytochrome c oxidase assembly protein subunit 15 [Vibrio xiamenensis]
MPFTWLVKFSIVLTLTVIVLGAYTRLSDAGLGCPDWPGCYGQLSVPQQPSDIQRAQHLFPAVQLEPHKAWLEMIHRYFAALLGVCIFAVSAIALKRALVGKLLPIALCAVVVFQSLLGMWTVTLKLHPLVVLGHLLGGFSLLCLTCLLYWRSNEHSQAHKAFSAHFGLVWLAPLALVTVLTQIALGGWTSANYAAFMCSELPFCEGSWSRFLDFDGAFSLNPPAHGNYEFGTLDYGARMTIHFTHRLGALLVSVVILGLCVQLWRQASPLARRCALSLFLLLISQIGLGISNVVFSLPLLTAVGHNLVAALLLVMTVYVNWLTWQAHSRFSSHNAYQS